LRTANLAILFTAIQGHTERTSRQTLEQNQRLLRTHAELLTPLLRAFGGRVVKAIGDTFLAVFESPTQALLASLAIQDRLWLHNQTALEPERLDVRLAVNVGEVRLEAGDVFGEPVNIAARVLGVAEAGEVFFTEAVLLTSSRAEVPAEEVGAYTLKGIPEQVRVYRVPHAPEHAGEGAASGVPPFAHRGLGRLPPLGPGRSRGGEVAERLEEGLGDLRRGASELGGRVADLGARAGPAMGSLGSRGGALAAEAGGRLASWSRTLPPRLTAARERLAARPPGLLAAGPRRLLLAGAAALAVLLLAFLLLRDPVLASIRSVEGAEGPEQGARVEAARRRIEAVQDAGRQAYYLGRLEEALGHGDRAVGRYRQAVREGEGDATDRLIDLLEAEDCRTRAAAARTLGELRVGQARGALEDLAEDGGPGEEESAVPFFGCSSRRAAQSALERL
jgi:class 3 adenylate cyclase